jgi:mannobiose 2-epimerase
MSQYGYGKEDIKKAAESAYLFIKEKCIDKEFGGVFWSVTYDGLPADTTKHTYNQAFAIYAMSEYYRAFGDKEALSIAKELLSIIEGKMRDEGGYLEAFTRDFKPASNEKLSENGVMATRTMNTLLHVMEGYSGLYRSSKDSEAGDRLREIYSIFKSHMYDEERDRQLVFFDHEYNSLIDLYSYGHDIETSWLMDMSADILGDSEWIPYIRRVTYEMAEAIYSEAFDGISLPSEAENGVVREIRVW